MNFISPMPYENPGENTGLADTALERGGKMAAEPKVEEMKISKEKKEGTQQKLFDFIAQSMADFLKKHSITRRLPLGFTFSFPVEQTSLTAGSLKRWTKDFKASGAEGRNVTEMLQEAIARREVRMSLSCDLELVCVITCVLLAAGR